VRNHVILATVLGAMLVAAAPAEVAPIDTTSTITIEDGSLDDDDLELPGFEDPTSREDCLRDAWKAPQYPFTNQGQCMRLLNESRRLSRP
jgi:hypothetical protein